ncbi:MAG: ankyrin repeat protein [Planctomycetota bacterium]|jgi:ankyrin repeat protein
MWIQIIVRAATIGFCLASSAAAPANTAIDPARGWMQDDRLAALNRAVRHNDLKLVESLLAAGADPNLANASGELLLDVVTTPEMVELLVEAGADPLRSGPNRAGRSLSRQLFDDGRARFQSIAAALVKAGAPCDLENAVRYGWQDDIRRLLAEDRPSEGFPVSLLYRALESGDAEVLQLLLDEGVETTGMPPRSQIINRWYPRSVVEYAAQVGGSKEVLALIRAGAPVEPEARGWASPPRGTSVPLGRFRASGGDLLDRAIDQGDVALFDLLVARGIEPTARKRQVGASIQSSSAIQDRVLRAAWRGHHRILDRLIAASRAASSNGAEPLTIDEPLLAAASAGHEELYDALRILAEPRTLHAAAALGRTEEIRSFLAERSGDHFQKDARCGASPLSWAVLHGRLEAAKLLLKRGANPTERIRREISTAIWDGARGTEMPSRPYYTTPEELSVLEHVLRKDEMTMARVLLEAGARVDSSALAALMSCTSTTATELLQAAKQAELVVTDSPDWACDAFTALLWTKMPKAIALQRVRLLLDMGAATSFRRPDGSPILRRAIRSQSNLDVATALRDAGAPVPPELAVLYDWGEPIEGKRWMESLDADEVRSLLHRAADLSGIEPTRRILAARPDLEGAVIVERLRNVAYKGRLDLIDVLLERAPEGYDYLADAELLSHGAGSPEFVQTLLGRGADPSATDRSGFGALHRAAQAGSAESIRILLAAGASPVARSYNGQTPLSKVADARRNIWRRVPEDEIAECARLLLEAGADPLSLDSVGRMTFETLLYSAETASLRAKIRDGLAPYVRADWLE